MRLQDELNKCAPQERAVIEKFLRAVASKVVFTFVSVLSKLIILCFIEQNGLEKREKEKKLRLPTSVYNEDEVLKDMQYIITINTTSIIHINVNLSNIFNYPKDMAQAVEFYNENLAIIQHMNLVRNVFQYKQGALLYWAKENRDKNKYPNIEKSLFYEKEFNISHSVAYLLMKYFMLVLTYPKMILLSTKNDVIYVIEKYYKIIMENLDDSYKNSVTIQCDKDIIHFWETKIENYMENLKPKIHQTAV